MSLRFSNVDVPTRFDYGSRPDGHNLSLSQNLDSLGGNKTFLPVGDTFAGEQRLRPVRTRRSMGGPLSWGSWSWHHRTDSGGNLALYEDEPSIPFVGAYLRAFTMPGPVERERSEKGRAKANLGVLLGVYLPTIQHIFGVLMFLRLFWVVGVMGVAQSFAMVFLCCLCTFLTCISMSAIATNGVVESGGSYFMISRNLGPEFGSAVGILFYLANGVATSMYLVGGVEIMLLPKIKLYMCPSMTIGGSDAQHDTGFTGLMSNNIRFYASLLLLVEFCIVALGVRFVQIFAPVSLFCVIVSVLSIYAGSVAKTFNSDTGPYVCMLDGHLLQASSFLPPGAARSSTCNYCTRNSSQYPAVSNRLLDTFCPNGTCDFDFLAADLHCIPGIPGFTSGVLFDNFVSFYMQQGESTPGVKADKSRHVFQDLSSSFYILLAIYFPSVTGIMTGSNMSGDLKDPQTSIPRGTIAAQLTTSFVYLSLTVIFAGSIAGPLLRDKYGQSLGGGMVVAELAWPSSWVLLIGSFTSTFGAALQCLCSAPRLLQSIAKDNVIPALRSFSVVSGNNEPIKGLLLTTAIAELAILIGAIDQIAPVVDFFFLMCYAFVNFICALHSLLGAPNWRPRFRFYHWTLSLLGAAICFFIMFSTRWDYALISLGLCLAIYKYVEWKGAKKEWGDGMRGLALTTAQYSLMKIEDKDPHPKNWRPQLLILTKCRSVDDDDSGKCTKLFHLGSQLKAGKGLTIVVSFLQGDPTDADDRTRAQLVKMTLKRNMEVARLKGFAKTMIFRKNQMSSSVSTLIQSAGIGGLRPNTLLVGWPTWQKAKDDGDQSEYWEFLGQIHRSVAMDMCLIVSKVCIDFPEPQQRLVGFIDVWWVLHDGGLLLLISFLLKQHKVWRGCELRLFVVAQEHDNSIQMKADLEQFVYHLRIDAHVIPQILVEKYRGSKPEELERLGVDGMEMEPIKHRTWTRKDGKMGKEQEFDSWFDIREKVHKNRSRSEPFNSDKLKLEMNEFRLTIEKEGDFAEKTTINEQIEEVNEENYEENDEENDEAIGKDEMDLSIESSSTKRTNSSENIFLERPKSQSPRNVTIADEQQRSEKLRRLDRNKVKKMHTAVRLNKKLVEHSESSQLVVLNLPRPPRSRVGLQNYMEYLEVLTDKLPRVLLVRGTGKEVITMYS